MTDPATDRIDPELYLRLLVENLIAALPAPVDEVARRLSELVVASSALVAVGALERDTAVRIARDAETALLVRGNEWMELDLGDLPEVRDMLDAAPVARPADLLAVVATGDVVVEQWSDHSRVHTPDGSWMLAGALDDGSTSLTVSVGGSAREIPLVGGQAARHLEARVEAVDVAAYVASLDDERRDAATQALRACGLVDG